MRSNLQNCLFSNYGELASEYRFNDLDGSVERSEACSSVFSIYLISSGRRPDKASWGPLIYNLVNDLNAILCSENRGGRMFLDPPDGI